MIKVFGEVRIATFISVHDAVDGSFAGT